MNELTPQPNFVLFTSTDGEVKLEVFLQDETIWLTQKMMAELFGVEIPTINYHLTEIYKIAELSEERTLRKIRIVQKKAKGMWSEKFPSIISTRLFLWVIA